MLEESNDAKTNYYLAIKNYFLQQGLTWGAQRTILQLLLQEFDTIEQQKTIEGINAFIAKAQAKAQAIGTTKATETNKQEIVQEEQEIEEEQSQEPVQPKIVPKIVRKEMPSQKPRIVIGDEEDDADSKSFEDEEVLPVEEEQEVEEKLARQLTPTQIGELAVRGKIKK